LPDDKGVSFSGAERLGVYRAIYERRDMRHFSGGVVSRSVLNNIISAGMSAPSVGLMQPWRFIHITKNHIRSKLYTLVKKEVAMTQDALEKEQGRGKEFSQIKVEGIRECAEVIVVCMTGERSSYIFGRRTIPEMDYASVGCCIQNMWLAARAEGLGMGWVSLFDPTEVKDLLSIPDKAEPVAILCLGPVKAFYNAPMLESEGWDVRKAPEQVFCENRWTNRLSG